MNSRELVLLYESAEVGGVLVAFLYYCGLAIASIHCWLDGALIAATERKNLSTTERPLHKLLSDMRSFCRCAWSYKCIHVKRHPLCRDV